MKIKIKTNVLVLAVSLLMVVRTNALIVSGTAPIDPLELRGCPDGSVAVADLTSSVGWWEGPPFGGGEWHIQFRGDAEALNQALTNFAAIKSPSLDLVIHDGVKNDQFLKTNVDWEFIVWNPEKWKSLYNSTNAALAKILKGDPNFGKPLPPPLLNIYIGDGQVDWDKVKVPANVYVRDERSKK